MKYNAVLLVNNALWENYYINIVNEIANKYNLIKYIHRVTRYMADSKNYLIKEQMFLPADAWENLALNIKLKTSIISFNIAIVITLVYWVLYAKYIE
jgi:hypothetical protein